MDKPGSREEFDSWREALRRSRSACDQFRAKYGCEWHQARETTEFNEARLVTHPRYAEWKESNREQAEELETRVADARAREAARAEKEAEAERLRQALRDRRESTNEPYF